MMRPSIVILGLVLNAAASAAFAFVDPPVLVPEHPVAGETISVSIRIGECDAFMEKAGFPQITRDGSAIRILLASVHATSATWCNFPVGTLVTPISELPAGSYTLQIDRFYDDFFGDQVVETLSVIGFNVRGAQPVMVPTLSKHGFAALLFGILLLASRFLARRQAASLLVTLLLLNPLGVCAQSASDIPTIAIMLDESAIAPSPQSVVAYYAAGPRSGKPPLASLAAGNPETVVYMLPLRASGDFRAFLTSHPGTNRAKLERYLVAIYPEGTNIDSALSALTADPKVAVAYEVPSSKFSSVQLLGYGVGSGNGPSSHYGRDALNIDTAWQMAGGYALVGMIDSGLAVAHPALRQFSSSSQYLGGNFVPVASLDFGGWPDSYDGNVDEAEPVPLPPDSVCNPQALPAVPPAYAGHGTHTSGLLAANVDAGLGVKGTCKNCGIAMWKVAYGFCDPTFGAVLTDLNNDALVLAINFLADTGAQVINMSFGGPRDDPDFCGSNPDRAYCVALEYARDREIVLVAASGNDRSKLNFPASDPRVVAAGGFEPGLLLWDESPGSQTNCPYYGELECGSNFTNVVGGPKQELMASADAVFSTAYPGYDWHPQLLCGDSFGTPMGDGVGLCTGTSMSSPQISGVMGIMRSINPLAPVGRATYNPLFDVKGIRYVVASTTIEAQANQGWSQTFGYGHPDAAAAARKMLGKVAGAVVRNRATPLFRMVTSATGDHAAVTSPQYAVSMHINQNKGYMPSGTLVPGYSFPSEVTLPAPRASAYVLTTEFKPRNNWPNLMPLHLVSKDYSSGLDFMLVTTDSDIEQAHVDGYDLRNIQGYIYQLCTPEPACIPPGTETFYRACKPADNDCAMFVESERATFEAAGFTNAWPVGSNKRLGYAYPPGDSDSDDLPDGFEYVVGTNINLADSDDDGSGDADEFPMTGVANGDPCAGGSLGASACPADRIFEDDFEL